LTTGNGGSAQTRDSFSYGGVGDLRANFDHCPRKLMPEDHRRVVAKRVVENVDIRSADSAIGDLQFYLVFPATRLIHL
jgi:hypothetical protein